MNYDNIDERKIENMIEALKLGIFSEDEINYITNVIHLHILASAAELMNTNKEKYNKAREFSEGLNVKVV